MSTTTMDPKVLGTWIRTVRVSQDWSQEALAAASSLTVRTVQRVEAGDPSHLTTRRALARALGYENKDVFDDPEFARSVEALIKEIGDTLEEDRRTRLEDQYPDFKRIGVQQCSSGQTLAVLAEDADAFVFNIREGVPQEAAELAKTLFDWIDDHNAISADLPPSSRMTMRESLGELIDEIQEAGGKLYIAQRRFRLAASEGDRIGWTIAYLTVFDQGAEVSEILVPRRIPA